MACLFVWGFKWYDEKTDIFLRLVLYDLPFKNVWIFFAALPCEMALLRIGRDEFQLLKNNSEVKKTRNIIFNFYFIFIIRFHSHVNNNFLFAHMFTFTLTFHNMEDYNNQIYLLQQWNKGITSSMEKYWETFCLF